MLSETIVLEPAVPPATFKTLVQLYYQLTKPGIVYSNVMTAAAGYLFASKWHVQLGSALALLVGDGLVIAASCVINNYLDRHIDAKMSRTRKRALVSGAIATGRAFVYAICLGTIGFGLLILTNWLTVIVGILAAVSYVVLYGLAKRRTVHGTLIGTVPGAASLVAGYTAATGRIDMVTALLFLTMVVWQMAHFYSIAIFRRSDYAAAGLPVRPVSRSVVNTKQHIVVYIIAFAVILVLYRIFGYEGSAFVVAMLAISILWLRQAVAGFHVADSISWARRTFFFSLIVLLVFSVALPLGVLLP